MKRAWMALAAVAAVGCTTALETAPPPPAPTPTATATPAASPAATAAPGATPTVAPLPSDLPPPEPAPVDLAARRVIGGFPGYAIYDARDPRYVADLPGDALTHVVYAGGKATAEGLAAWGDPYADGEREFPDEPAGAGVGGNPRGNFGQLARLKERHDDLQALIGIGGWVGSTGVSLAARTAEGRQRFAASVVSRFLDDAGDAFDGVALEWQWPVAGGPPGQGAPEDRANYTALAREVRRQLDNRGRLDRRRYLLTVALPGSRDLAKNFDLTGLAEVVDWFDVRTYGYHGPAWEGTTNFTGPLYAGDGQSVDLTMRAYVDAGVIASKLVLGVSAFGHGWRNVPARNDGLFQPAHSPWVPAGTRDADPGRPSGTFDHDDVVERLLPVGKRSWSPVHQVPWLYLPSRGWFVAYEDEESIDAKVRYVQERNLGGLAFSDLTAEGKTYPLAHRAAERLLRGRAAQ